MDGPIYEAEARKKADEFLMGQQLYYRAVKNQNEEVERFRRTRSEYQQALELLEELPTRVSCSWICLNAAERYVMAEDALVTNSISFLWFGSCMRRTLQPVVCNSARDSCVNFATDPYGQHHTNTLCIVYVIHADEARHHGAARQQGIHARAASAHQ